MLYITVRGCDFAILNVHAPIEDEDDMKGSFYKEFSI
jgi:hypothetical protein